jgi:hypothetical protein
MAREPWGPDDEALASEAEPGKPGMTPMVVFVPAKDLPHFSSQTPAE